MSPPVPVLITDQILEEKVSLIVFKSISPKLLSATYIFSNIIMTNLKKLIGNKSLKSKQCPGNPGIGENTSQQPSIYRFSPPEKSSLINAHLPLSKASFLPNQIVILI